MTRGFILFALSQVAFVLLFVPVKTVLSFHTTQPLINIIKTTSSIAPARLTLVRSAITSVENEEYSLPNSSNKSLGASIKNGLNVLYKFSRPHTIKGTILASVMGVTRALIENPGKVSLDLVPRAVIGLLALLCGNAYIVGINQIYDVQIDKINKPFLPIAAKMLSTTRAWQLVFACLITGVTIVKTQFSAPIFQLYMLGTILGTIYSVPPLQLKRIPFFAGTIIAFVRGFLLNFGVYYAVREALGVSFGINPVVAFISTFMTVFASVIAVTKDLPDIEGDVKYKIDTLAAKYGVKNIAFWSTGALAMNYVAAIVLPFLLPGTFSVWAMTLGHSGSLIYLLSNYKKLDPDSQGSIKAFYKSIWNLFYFEYCLYPFI